MADGFLGRWAKRKEAVRQGKEVPAEPVKSLEAEVPPPQPSPGRGGSNASLPPALGEGRGGGALAEPPPSPTLEDTHSLTPESDFTRFMQPDVGPDVKNAAMKKLFADPHFNVMDRLDTYIDDYSKPDPIPPEMLRNLVSAQFLRLFEEKEEDKDEQDPTEEAEVPAPRDVSDGSDPQSVAQSSTRTEHALPPADDHADPDLRLQQDDAPGRKGPGAGAG
jgi:hypothetical protein